MKLITLTEVSDGYQIHIEGDSKWKGDRVRSNEDSKLIEMLEMVGEVVLDYRVKIERR